MVATMTTPTTAEVELAVRAALSAWLADLGLDVAVRHRPQYSHGRRLILCRCGRPLPCRRWYRPRDGMERAR
jgi:hypothetical protein